MIRYSLSCVLFDTHAKVSVLSAHGSLRIASASRWLDACAGVTNARSARTRSAPDIRRLGESLMFSPLFRTAFLVASRCFQVRCWSTSGRMASKVRAHSYLPRVRLGDLGRLRIAPRAP